MHELITQIRIKRKLVRLSWKTSQSFSVEEYSVQSQPSAFVCFSVELWEVVLEQQKRGRIEFTFDTRSVSIGQAPLWII